MMTTKEMDRILGDNATADSPRKILGDKEGHVDMLETELSMIEQLGLENYLARQMGEAK